MKYSPPGEGQGFCHGIIFDDKLFSAFVSRSKSVNYSAIFLGRIFTFFHSTSRETKKFSRVAQRPDTTRSKGPNYQLNAMTKSSHDITAECVARQNVLVAIYDISRLACKAHTHHAPKNAKKSQREILRSRISRCRLFMPRHRIHNDFSVPH